MFDGDCGFCTRSAEWARRRLTDDHQVVAWQRLPDVRLIGLTLDDVTSAAYWIDSEGRAHRGERGVAKTLLEIGGVWAIGGRLLLLPGISALAGVVYRLIARNRHRMPGGTAACKVEDQRAGGQGRT